MTTATPSIVTPATGDPFHGVNPERSFLDLMHPDGVARTVGGIGQRCAGRSAMVDGNAGSGTDGYGALQVEPDAAECRRSDWLRESVSRIDRLLAVDGIAYIRLPRRLRSVLATELDRAGLKVASPFIHLHYGSSTEYIVECDAAALAFLASSLPMRVSRERLMRAGLQLPGAGSWLARAAHNVGFAVQRKESRPLSSG